MFMNGGEAADRCSCARVLTGGTAHPGLGLQVILRRGDHCCVGHHLYVTTSFAMRSRKIHSNTKPRTRTRTGTRIRVAGSLTPFAAPKAPVASFKISGDVLHIAFHPSGSQFAVVCPRAKDEVYFYWRIRNQGEEVWEKREDVGLGGPYIESGSEEVSETNSSL